MAATSSAAARRYAKALLALAREGEQVDAVREELVGFASLVEQMPALEQVLARPLFPAAQRRAVLDRLTERLGLSPLLRNFCAFLIDQRRMIELSAIRSAYERLADEAAGRTHAEVISAGPLADDELGRVREALARHTGGEVEVSVRVEPDLIGGVIARVGDLVFDGSLRTQLAQVRASLTRE